MKIWFKMMADTRIIRTETIEDDRNDTRTHKIFRALENICHEWDLAVPSWLKANQNEFLRRASTRFTQDNFVETIDFDYLEIQVLEED